ncbi:MAG: hypothetical protein WAL63_10410 [Solirubrobacteraceae bacterium]
MTQDPSPKPDPELAEYVSDHAPELDPGEVAEFMEQHPKPDHEPGAHVEWAVRVLRSRGEGEFGDGLPVDQVVREIRRRDR